jgi:hypothetical protein
MFERPLVVEIRSENLVGGGSKGTTLLPQVFLKSF